MQTFFLKSKCFIDSIRLISFVNLGVFLNVFQLFMAFGLFFPSGLQEHFQIVCYFSFYLETEIPVF